MPEKRAVQISQTSSPIEQRPLSEQERQLKQMEKIYGFLGNMIKVMQHPAFDRYKTSDQEGKSWNIGLIKNAETNMIECATPGTFSVNEISLSIENVKRGALVNITFPGKSGAYGLVDPTTQEDVLYARIYYKKEAASRVQLFIRDLLGSKYRYPQEVSLYEHTFGEIPLATEELVEGHEETVLETRKNNRVYKIKYDAFPSKEDKGKVIFETFYAAREDEEDDNRVGYPQFQIFPMSDEHAIALTQAIETFVFPAFAREMHREPQVIENGRRIKRKLLNRG